MPLENVNLILREQQIFLELINSMASVQLDKPYPNQPEILMKTIQRKYETLT